MKKLAMTLLACLAVVQVHAATSALTESLLEYEAITNAIGTDPAFDNIIPSTEFIIDIDRLTREVNVLGTVKYKILTNILTSGNEADWQELEGCSCKHHHHHHHHHNTHAYIATLNVAPNPGIGPNIVTVVSITPISE